MRDLSQFEGKSHLQIPFSETRSAGSAHSLAQCMIIKQEVDPVGWTHVGGIRTSPPLHLDPTKGMALSSIDLMSRVTCH